MEFGITILLIGYIGSMGVLGAMAVILIGGTALWLLGMAVMMVLIHVIEPWQERSEAERKRRYMEEIRNGRSSSEKKGRKAKKDDVTR